MAQHKWMNSKSKKFTQVHNNRRYQTPHLAKSKNQLQKKGCKFFYKEKWLNVKMDNKKNQKRRVAIGDDLDKQTYTTIKFPSITIGLLN